MRPRLPRAPRCQRTAPRNQITFLDHSTTRGLSRPTKCLSQNVLYQKGIITSAIDRNIAATTRNTISLGARICAGPTPPRHDILDYADARRNKEDIKARGLGSEIDSISIRHHTNIQCTKKGTSLIIERFSRSAGAAKGESESQAGCRALHPVLRAEGAAALQTRCYAFHLFVA